MAPAKHRAHDAGLLTEFDATLAPSGGDRSGLDFELIWRQTKTVAVQQLLLATLALCRRFVPISWGRAAGRFQAYPL